MPDKRVAVVFWCVNGHTRSVATATSVAWIWHKKYGVDVSGFFTHLSQPTWKVDRCGGSRRFNCPAMCQFSGKGQCYANWMDLDYQVLEHLAQMWRNAVQV